MVGASALAGLRRWPLPWVAPLAAYFVLVTAVPPLRATFWRPRFGQISGVTFGVAFLISAVSCGALIGFQATQHPDMQIYKGLLPVRELGGVIPTGICFALLNALLEELVFRGVLFEAFTAAWGSSGSLLATSAIFGYGHMRGYPQGPVGAAIAGVYGLSIGWLRMRTGGIGLPVAAHIVADVTIYSIIANAGAL